MVFRASALLICGLLAACGRFRDPQPAPLLSIADGNYTAVIGGACIALEFGRRDRQTYIRDGDCDGSPEFSSSFAVVDNVIQTEGGTLTVTAVGGASFSGIWTVGDVATEVRFDRAADS